MTFAPEWLSGCESLVTSHWMLLWVYLVFFNTLWVWIPIWVLWEAYSNFGTAFQAQEVEFGVGRESRKTI